MIPDQTRPDVSVLLFTMSGSRAEKGHRHNACALRSVVADRPRRSGDPQFRTDRQYLLLPPSHAGRKIQGKKIHMYGRVLYYNVLCIPGFSNDLGVSASLCLKCFGKEREGSYLYMSTKRTAMTRTGAHTWLALPSARTAAWPRRRRHCMPHTGIKTLWLLQT